MKVVILPIISALALVTAGERTGIDVHAGQSKYPAGAAELVQVNDQYGPEHMYIRIPGGLVGRDGKRIKDRFGKVVDTWGFYFRPLSKHGSKVMTGVIRGPDPMSAVDGQVVAKSDDPVFQQALAVAIKGSKKHVPIYTWGNGDQKEYVCWDWAKDMWTKAERFQ